MCAGIPKDILLAMAKEGFFPKKFAEINEKTGVPCNGDLASSGSRHNTLVIFNSLQSLTDLLITLSGTVECNARRRCDNLQEEISKSGKTFIKYGADPDSHRDHNLLWHPSGEQFHRRPEGSSHRTFRSADRSGGICVL